MTSLRKARIFAPIELMGVAVMMSTEKKNVSTALVSIVDQSPTNSNTDSMLSVMKEKMKNVDASKYGIIVFDEIYCNDIHKLAKIKKLVNHNLDKIIIATGDMEQTGAIDVACPEVKIDEYTNRCTYMFPFNVCLQSNKRLTNEDEH